MCAMPAESGSRRWIFGVLTRRECVNAYVALMPGAEEMLLVTALAPADWERLEPDLPKIRRVFREELAFARAALMQLKDECVRRGLADERHRQRTQGRHDEPDPQEGDQG